MIPCNYEFDEFFISSVILLYEAQEKMCFGWDSFQNGFLYENTHLARLFSLIRWVFSISVYLLSKQQHLSSLIVLFASRMQTLHQRVRQRRKFLYSQCFATSGRVDARFFQPLSQSLFHLVGFSVA
ncbi:Hypothetical protein Tpal_1586 [Trichococcus palustris]|uniref:Uncharacterized protein n=1 Tax=Trichococcus palustris TaxID=140314 RepID=A0A143YQF9_9LACT|nr:Hypothetical protein Tpal_1586 [Trichococcus palustris]SFK84944.1 hypothetical protein SAMN04488076_106137 [Trichococcus palustris]